MRTKSLLDGTSVREGLKAPIICGADEMSALDFKLWTRLDGDIWS